MDYKEIFLFVIIPINIIITIIAVKTLAKKHKEGKITDADFKLKIVVAILVPIAGLIISKLS